MTASLSSSAPSAAAPRRRRLLPSAVLLTAAVFLVPAGYAALRGFRGEGSLVAATKSAFVRADLPGSVADSAALAELTTVWREFHVVKAVLAGLLVVVLVGLVASVRRRAEASGRGGRRWLLRSAYAGAVVWLLAAVTLLLANLQGAAAPFASVASFLPAGGSGEVGGVLGELRGAVEAGSPASVGGVAGALLGDFTWYHAVFAVLAAVTGVALTVLALGAVWRRWRVRGSGPSPQPTWLLRAGLFGAAGAAFLLLAAANASTWLHPVPALVASLGG
ncbi:hypothetical protein [Phycicoccus sp.]|uniref:hypothetical protein n=1 Tax=Phycicoccus sp. TaxID=1902410 RepID=UPI002C8647C8|nr:hypothetical protein [Phycicoccus sp.]HMM95823.1 hypothetical protein [Phycicoccus sp.]